MKVLVVGLGSAGRRHLRHLRALLPQADITVWRQQARPDNAGAPPREADRVVFDLHAALSGKPDIAVIANPASRHIATAMPLAESGAHLLIEKPIADSFYGVDGLIAACRNNKRILMVGYTLRFYPPLMALREAFKAGRIGRLMSVRAEVGQYLPDWRPDRDYRETVSAQRELGGGALLELSHEIDSLRWIAGEAVSVSARIGRYSDLDIDVEDTAELLVDLECGALASVHLDMVQRPPIRGFRLIGSSGTLDLDLLTDELVFTSGRREVLHAAGSVDFDGVYASELRHFLDCVAHGRAPVCDGEDGRRTLQVVLAARQASDEGRQVRL